MPAASLFLLCEWSPCLPALALLQFWDSSGKRLPQCSVGGLGPKSQSPLYLLAALGLWGRTCAPCAFRTVFAENVMITLSPLGCPDPELPGQYSGM